MGFDNPYRNVNRDSGCFFIFMCVLFFAFGYGLAKLF